MKWYNKMMATLCVGSAIAGAYILGMKTAEIGPKHIPYREFREGSISGYVFNGHVVQDIKKKDLNADDRTDFIVLHQRPKNGRRTLEEPGLSALISSQRGYDKYDLRLCSTGYDSIDDILIIEPEKTNTAFVVLGEKHDPSHERDYILSWGSTDYQKIPKQLDKYLIYEVTSGHVNPISLASELRKHHVPLVMRAIGSVLKEMSSSTLDRYLADMLTTTDVRTVANISASFGERIPSDASRYLTRVLYRGPRCNERDRIAWELSKRGERGATDYLCAILEEENRSFPGMNTWKEMNTVDALTKIGGLKSINLIANSFLHHPHDYLEALLGTAKTKGEKEWLARFFNETIFDNTYSMCSGDRTYAVPDDDAERLMHGRVHCSMSGLRQLRNDCKSAEYFLHKMPRIFVGIGPDGYVYLSGE